MVGEKERDVLKKFCVGIVAVVLVGLLAGCNHGSQTAKDDAAAQAQATDSVTVTTETVTKADGSKVVTVTTCSCKDGKKSCSRTVTHVAAPAKAETKAAVTNPN